MRFTKFIFFLFLIFHFSCKKEIDKKNPIETLHTKTILIKNDQKQISLDNNLELKKIINLETTEESFISKIDNIFHKDSLIYILDKEKQNTIFIFKDNGEFVKKINNQGRGPNEYIGIQDVEIYDNSIHILDRSGKKILVFSLLGEFLNSIKVDDYFINFKAINKDSLILYSSFYSLSNKQFTIANKNGQSLHKFLEIPKKQNFIISYNIFSKTKDVCLYTLPYQNNIYTFKNGKPKILFNIDFDGRFLNTKYRELPFEVIRNTVFGSKGKIIEKLDNLILIDDILYFNYNYENVVRSVFVKYPSGKLLDVGILAGDKKNPFISFKPIGQIENQLIFKVNPDLEYERFQRLKTKPEYAKYLKPYETIFENLSKGMTYNNPSLLFYSISKKSFNQ